MPKVITESGKKNQQIKAVIKSHMILNNLNAEKAAKKMNISVSLFYTRMREPDGFRISELRCLNLSDEEWEKIR